MSTNLFEVEYRVPPADEKQEWPSTKTCLVLTEDDAWEAVSLVREKYPRAWVLRCVSKMDHADLVVDPRLIGGGKK